MSSSQDQTQEQNASIQNFKYSKRVVLKSILDREDKGLGLVGQRVVVGGWVKSKREKKDKISIVASLKEAKEEGGQYVTCCEAILSRIPILRSICKAVARRDGIVGKYESTNIPSTAYLKINDGSSVHNLRVVVDSSMSLLHQAITTGSSVLVEGILEKPAVQGKHDLQLKVEKILHVGVVDLKNYPLAKKRLSLDFIRAYPHIRPRSTTIATITRVKSTLFYTAHAFLRDNGFIYVHMPVVSSDTNITEGNKGTPIKPEESNENVRLEVIKASMEEKSHQVEELKRSSSNKEALLAAIKDLQETNELVAQMEEKQKESSAKARELNHANNDLIYNKELYLESYACALSSVYTFGPIVTAKDSRTLNLSEETIWRVEVELAFAELEDAMNCSEDLLKYMFQSTLNDCLDDMKFLSKRIDKNCVDRLQSIVSSPFARTTYAEALEHLKNVDKELEWGVELTKEHESYLANKIFKKPVIIHDYPKEVKPFYVHVKEDGRTASAFDIIAPKVGALIRGSQKEEKFDKIKTRIEEVGLPREQYEWYLDLRRHGTVEHSGFRVEFENVVLFATGLDDIRDAIPFPCSSDPVNI